MAQFAPLSDGQPQWLIKLVLLQVLGAEGAGTQQQGKQLHVGTWGGGHLVWLTRRSGTARLHARPELISK